MQQLFHYIESDHDLALLCNEVEKCDVIALDTEFFRETTYFPKPALIQLYDGENVYLIDPLAIEDFSPFSRLLTNNAVLKVMHSCSEDLEVFSHLLGIFPSPVFDTQLAAAFCGYGFSASYQKLVEVLLDKVIGKTETRSNWLRRPLTESQFYYAANDVLWLLDIFNLLKEQLKAKERDAWCTQDCQIMLLRAEEAQNEDKAYLRINGAWKLRPNQLNDLRALCRLREQLAKSKDVPRGRVVVDAVLLGIALTSPQNLSELSAVDKISSASMRQYGDAILETMAKSQTMNTSEYPPSMMAKNTRVYRELMKKLQCITRSYAEEMNLPFEALARKRDLEEYLYNKEHSLIVKSWRSAVLAEKLDDEIVKSGFIRLTEQNASDL